MRCAKGLGLMVVLMSLATMAAAGILVLDYNSLEVEPNDTRNSAGWLVTADGFPPSFWMDADDDYYRLFVLVVPTTLTVNVEGVPGNNPAARIVDISGGVLAMNEDIDPGVNPNVFMQYVFATSGTFFVHVYHQDRPNYDPLAAGYTLFGQLIQQDDDPPTYTIGLGVDQVVRDGFGSAFVRWGYAVDNFTPPDQIIYNIYWSPTLQDLFTPPPEATHSGDFTFTTVSGLDPKQHYYFGVRAQDLQGNEEQNTVYVFAPVFLAVNPAHWSLYR